MRLIRYLKNRKIQTRISVFYLVLMVCSIILLTTLLYQIAAHTVQKRTADTLNVTLKNIDSGLQTLMQDMTQSAKLLISNADVQQINTLSAPISGHSETQRFMRLQKLCSSILAAKPQITELVLYTADGKRVLTTRLYLRTSGNEDWDLDLANKLNPAQIGLAYVTGTENSLIHMAMIIRNLNDFSKIGYALFGINRNVFFSDLKEQIGNLHGNAYIVTNSNTIVTAVRNIPFENEPGVIEACLKKSTDDASYHSVHVENQSLLTISLPMEFQDWTLLLIVPKEVITGDLRYMSYTSIAIAIAIISVTWLMTLFLSRGISRPIIQVAAAMKRFEKGDFTVRCEEASSGDHSPRENANEIAYLSFSFNRMIEQLDQMFNQNYRLQLLEKDMEVQLLQTQLDPHFLYNTLDIIYYLAKEHHVQDISDIVLALCNLSRASISQKESLVTVAEDLDFANNYLTIIRIRFGKKLTITVDLDESVLAYRIPKLTLQPILENAIQHGLEKRSGHWKIDICGTIQNGYAVISVSDNGVGIPPERLEEIQGNTLSGDQSHAHIGLSSLTKRLQLLLGPRATLSIQSVYNEGTTICLMLPPDDKAELEEQRVSSSDCGG